MGCGCKMCVCVCLCACVHRCMTAYVQEYVEAEVKIGDWSMKIHHSLLYSLTPELTPLAWLAGHPSSEIVFLYPEHRRGGHCPTLCGGSWRPQVQPSCLRGFIHSATCPAQHAFFLLWLLLMIKATDTHKYFYFPYVYARGFVRHGCTWKPALSAPCGPREQNAGRHLGSFTS